MTTHIFVRRLTKRLQNVENDGFARSVRLCPTLEIYVRLEGSLSEDIPDISGSGRSPACNAGHGGGWSTPPYYIFTRCLLTLPAPGGPNWPPFYFFRSNFFLY